MKKEQGITLIELLAALSILVIISSTLYGILNGVNKNFYQITGKSNLEQEANIIITTLKNYHQHENSYKLFYDTKNKKAYIGVATANNQLERSDIDILLEAGYPNYNIFSGEITIDPSSPLHVYIKLSNSRGQSYEIDTILKRY